MLEGPYLSDCNGTLQIPELLLDAIQLVYGGVRDDEGTIRLLVVLVELFHESGEEDLAEGLGILLSGQCVLHVADIGGVGIVSAVILRVGQVVAQPAPLLAPIRTTSSQGGGSNDLEP